jgi:hypothetical protein
MSLTPPKRLFHIPTMSTVMYKDVASDVINKKYAAVSHVWGKQYPYSAEELGIKGGVTWKIPLSGCGKMVRLRVAMTYYKMEYCWWDILCMPQDKQDEINLEIPFMGDYYAGARTTFVLSDVKYIISGDFPKWNNMMTDIMRSRNPTLDEISWMMADRSSLLDFSSDKWFDRVWTLQEAVLSRKILCVDINGSHFNLSDLMEKIHAMLPMSIIYPHNLFGSGIAPLVGIGNMIEERENGKLNLIRTLVLSMSRDCYKIHDKFYGIFGMLGYKDFIVDYSMHIDELNKYVVQYAYSKGDVSWMAIDAGIKSFIQPMYENFTHVGVCWKEGIVGHCNVIFEEYIHIETMKFGTVVYKDSFIGNSIDFHRFLPWIVCFFKNWGFNSFDILYSIMGYILIRRDFERACIKIIDIIAEKKSVGSDFRHEMARRLSDEEYVYITQFLSNVALNVGSRKITIVKTETKNAGSYPLIITGTADIGDEIVVANVLDSIRSIGIVTSNFVRKGICLAPAVAVTEEDRSKLFTMRKFLL